MTIGLGHYLSVAAILFTLGVFGIFLNRKNVIVILMSIELILLAVNINLVAFSTFLGDIVGQVYRADRAHGRGGGSRDRACHPRRLFPQPRLDRGRRHQSDEGLSGMYQAIVFLPLLGAIIAGVIALVGARNRFPGRSAAAARRSCRARASAHAHARVAARAWLDQMHTRTTTSRAAAAGSLAAELITTTFLVISCVLSWFAFFDVGFGGTMRACRCSRSSPSATCSSDWALRIDPLTAVMLVVVTTVSALVHLYSIGYMEDDPYQPRFFSYLSLFTFAMLMLVTADNLVQLFFGWEGVGLASYLLIGFWFHKPEANAAAIKAFIVNRVGDFGFSLGIFAVFYLTGAIDFDTVFAQAPGLVGKTFHFLSWDVDALTVICLLLFMGAMGKSAQFLLHTWLPDAMEGPTPVSALIHAATMVTAGVFMVARLSPLFELAPDAPGLRHLHRRDDGDVRRDRRPGAERHQAHRRLFDLLAARLHVRRHGRRRLFGRHVPPVHPCLLQGAAVPRLGLGDPRDASRAGHPPHGRPVAQNPVHLRRDGDRHAGADRISVHRRLFLQGRHHRGRRRRHNPMAIYGFIMTVAAAALTSFYSWRLIFKTFHGAPHDQHHYEAAHESPKVMLIPLAMLAIGSIAAGWPFLGIFTGQGVAASSASR